MKVASLGHAGLRVETARATLLIDPWFSPEGAFQASWFQYPDNSHLLEPELFSPTAILISQGRMDHFDPWFLARVPATVPVVVPRYPSSALRRKIELAGAWPVVEVAAWKPCEVAEGVTVFFVPEDSPMNHDSAIVLMAGERTLLNLNDARLSPLQLRTIRERAGGVIDVFAFQGAGASWYPMCYRYDNERKREKAHQKRLAKLSYVARSIGVLAPVTAVPFAGPPCFLDPEIFQRNAEMDGGILPDQEQVAGWLRGRGLDNVAVLLPGDVWDVEAEAKEPDPVWDGFSFEERWPYLEAYAARRRPQVKAVRARFPQPDDRLWDEFQEYFQRLLGMSPYFNRKIGMRVGFEVTGPGGGSWAVDFGDGCQAVLPELGDCGYVFTMASRWLRPILREEVPWEDFLLSLRFEAQRSPDVPNDHLLGLLKYADQDSLAAVERFETSMASEQRITVHAAGQAYSVARYCPHAGNDLEETGDVLPGGVLRCLAHHYEFDLATGRCLNGSGLTLDVEPLEASPSH
ncbi:MAG: Rieske 2Fe-2S domain-containing protein [Actinomycetota bacterium]